MLQSIAGKPGFLSRERTVAGPSFNRWLVPPAALAIHLCIGMIYGFSVFWLPLSKAIGVTSAKTCPADMSLFAEAIARDCDWKISSLTWTFTFAIVFLGSSAAVFGHWLETAGPRKAGLASAFCWCGGLLMSALGVYAHQLWLIWLGSGVIGGIGLGLGYISPVSTLIKWFPDRRGMATGLAIMGFGGGAMIGAPLANYLIGYFTSAAPSAPAALAPLDAVFRRLATPNEVGVWQTFLALGLIYFVFMVCGAFGYRVPRDGWTPAGWTPPAPAANAMVTHRHVHLETSWKTPQFWLLWGVLCLNVSAGIGVLSMASPMLQEVFGGRLLGLDIGFDSLSATQKTQIATIAAGFTGLLSLCNIFGRIGWASFSDRLGRKLTYAVFFLLGGVLYALAPAAARAGLLAVFVLAFSVILTMYGGGFATIPAYLADLFGTHMVGAIHGRLLTAWSTAGVVGPWLVTSFRERQLAAGAPKAAVYDQTMYVLAGLLVIGLICDLLVRPVAAKYFMTDEEVAAEKHTTVAAVRREDDGGPADFEDFEEEERQGRAVRAGRAGTRPALGVGGVIVMGLAWLVVGAPLAWGVWVTLQKTAAMFH
ncbi:OFA family MFS transporter [Methylocystis bryophila]|uniref:MFS transporter n=1 Tax=Methylocystis bryophila TaxID=655015 RepID=A0A1W6MTL2_9HYPH|nr:OFA family MFS transporter [Methylocystis bryophila]ARN80963.1 MFS transporter [Methylocystis bryophila]BDV36867.1 MFS transporter [Methylocystis bryophila]